MHAQHSDDYRSVDWFGQFYQFSPTQGAIVAILWRHWENGVPEVSQDYLLEAVGSEANRLTDLFRGGRGRHPAWGTMIQPGSTRGTYRLVPPEDMNGACPHCGDSTR